jgi:microcystin degradation protein MlrC
MTRIAMAGFSHETNTFSPLPTTYDTFTTKGEVQRGILEAKDLQALRGQKLNNAYCGFYEVADTSGYDVVPLMSASATPSGAVSMDAFDQITSQITSMLKEQGPFDGLFLGLHGAMVYQSPQGYQDGETEILRRVRAVVGEIPVVASLDLHGNIPSETVDLASGLVGFRTYPHVDVYETGRRCARLMRYIIEGKPLYKSYRQMPFLIPISSMSTNTQPAGDLYKQVNALENTPGIISVTFMEGFPPADIYDAGPSIFVYADSQSAADEEAEALYSAIMGQETQFTSRLIDVERAVQRALPLSLTTNKPVILADVQDNAGAGSTSDTPWILEALVEYSAQDAALGIMYDPEAARIAHESGEGSSVHLGLGGKLTPGQSPYEADYHVEKLFEGEFTATGPMAGGRRVNLGKMAQLRIHGVRVVVSSVRTQALDQSYFRMVGIEPSEMKILVLKSSNHYRADFEPISSAIIPVAAPAAMIDDPQQIPYKNLRPGVRLGRGGPEFQG